MKYSVISLNPPYGSLIAACAVAPDLGKHIETRDWPTSYRGPLLIHQTKGLGEMFTSEAQLWELCRTEPFRTTLSAMGHADSSTLPRGAIVAVCKLRYCYKVPGDGSVGWKHNGDEWTITDTERAFGNYSPGRYAWLLADIRALPEPIAARGLPGLWQWEGELP